MVLSGSLWRRGLGLAFGKMVNAAVNGSFEFVFEGFIVVLDAIADEVLLPLVSVAVGGGSFIVGTIA